MDKNKLYTKSRWYRCIDGLLTEEGIYGHYLTFYGVCVFVNERGKTPAVSLKALCVFVVLCSYVGVLCTCVGVCCVLCVYVLCVLWYTWFVCLYLYDNVHMWWVGVCMWWACYGRTKVFAFECVYQLHFRTRQSHNHRREIPSRKQGHLRTLQSYSYFSSSYLTNPEKRIVSPLLTCLISRSVVYPAGHNLAIQPLNPLGMRKEKLMAHIYQAMWGVGIQRSRSSVPCQWPTESECSLLTLFQGNLMLTLSRVGMQPWLTCHYNKHIFIAWSIYASFGILLGFRSGLTIAPLSSDITLPKHGGKYCRYWIAGSQNGWGWRE